MTDFPDIVDISLSFAGLTNSTGSTVPISIPLFILWVRPK